MKKILRFYMSSTDTYKHLSVYELIAREAKTFGLSGATVYRGSMGFGESSELRSDKFWELVIKQPVIVEIIDEEAKLRAFAEQEQGMLNDVPKGCLITLQDIDILYQKSGEKKK
jgi:PII-like signaling protein